MCPKGVIKRSVEGEGADAVASAHGERPGSTHKVAEVQCSRNTTSDPWQPHACIGLTAMAARALRAGLAFAARPTPCRVDRLLRRVDPTPKHTVLLLSFNP